MRRWLAFTVGVCVLLTRTAHAEESCGTCHPNVKTEYAESIHAKHAGCTACHGGDAAVVGMEAHDASKGYVGKPARKDIPALCASCHADPNRMKPFGLATDQYAQYLTSQHGIRLAQGDTRVAVCTDCHRTHRILGPKEPTSSVFRRNVSATCGQCHGDQPLMAQYELPADQQEKFRHSVHGTALFDDEHPLAPTCATCHGAHGATALQNGTIGTVCGQCHTRTREYFSASPHQRAADAGKMSECVSCHGYHDIARPDHTLFDTACPQCHAADSPALATAQKLKTLLTRANESLETSAAEMTRAQTVFPTVVRYRLRLQQATAYFMEALPVQHSLALDRVDDLTRNARSISEDVRASIHGVEQQRQVRYVGLGLVWIFILFAVGTAALFKRELRRRRDGSSGPGSQA